jgi:hypothetical protein
MPSRGRRGNRGGARGRGRIRRSIESREDSRLAQEIAESSDPSISPTASDSENDDIDIALITILGQEYHRAKNVAGKRTAKTSGIWKHGFEIIHAENKKKYYYCKLCLDDKKDMAYKPLVINGTLTIRSHFRSKHGFDPVMPDSDKERETSSRISTTSSVPGPIELVFHTILDKVKLLLIRWIVFSHIDLFKLKRVFQTSHCISQSPASQMPSDTQHLS